MHVPPTYHAPSLRPEKTYPSCPHLPPHAGHPPLVEIRLVREEPGWVTMALACKLCGQVLDEQRMPAALKCVAAIQWVAAF